MSVKGVLLDFDGTIVLSEESRFSSTNEVLKKFNISISLQEWNIQYKRMNSRDIYRDISNKYNISIPIEETYKEAKKIREVGLQNNGVKVAKGFFEFIDFLQEHSIKILICSGGNREHIEMSMRLAGISGLEFLGREDYLEEKPAPDCFVKGLEMLDILPEETIVIDDSYNGMVAGLKAGCRVIGINCMYEKGVEELPLESRIEDFTQIKFDEF